MRCPSLSQALGGTDAAKARGAEQVVCCQNDNANGASRARTGDLLGAIQALSQLSYSPGGRRL